MLRPTSEPFHSPAAAKTTASSFNVTLDWAKDPEDDLLKKRFYHFLNRKPTDEDLAHHKQFLKAA
jgi:hypothetical protein